MFFLFIKSGFETKNILRMFLFYFFKIISLFVPDVKPSIIGKKKPMAAKKGVSHSFSRKFMLVTGLDVSESVD